MNIAITGNRRISETILYLLKRADERGVHNLSKFQIMKLLYLIEVEYRRYLGKGFFETPTFTRFDRGPILNEAYPIIDTLISSGKVKLTIQRNPGYGHDRHSHSLNNPDIKVSLRDGEKIFLNSIIDSYIELTQAKLSKIAYSTEPMKKVLAKEKGGEISKEALDMGLVKKQSFG